jgi:hypothetical protein
VNKSILAPLTAVALGLTLVACPPSGAPKPPAEPQPTPVGTPTGTLVTNTIGPAGGVISSADGSLSVNVPAGAVLADTSFGLEPITNTAWSGLGSGFRLTPSGATFLKPVTLRFKPSATDLKGASLGQLGIAFQNPQGVWEVLEDAFFDAASQSLSATTTHFTDFATFPYVELRPASSLLKVKNPLILELYECVQRARPSDPKKTTVVKCQSSRANAEEGVSGGYRIKSWVVNGVTNGNATVGVISKADAYSGTYTAPAKIPSSGKNVSVAVGVSSDGQPNQNVDADASIELLSCGLAGSSGRASTVQPTADTCADAWTGRSSKSEYDNPSTGTRESPVSAENVRWELEASESTDTVRVYRLVSGTASVPLPAPRNGCAVTAISPISAAINRDDSILWRMVVDYGQQPPTFDFGASTVWIANVTTECAVGSGPPTKTSEETVGGPWGAGVGVLSADGSTIAGTYTDNGRTYTFEFTRE